MKLKFIFAIVFIVSTSLVANAQEAPADNTPPQGGDFSSNPNATKVPQGLILVKGAEPSASDASTPVPEGASVTEKAFLDPYFGMAYQLPAGWTQKYVGPPPSDSGYYVLAQIEPGKNIKSDTSGTILISAQDLFFTLAPAASALELINFRKSRLSADYKLERPPSEVKIGGHSFLRMDYMSPVAELHWYTLATQIRCHAVEFLMTSRDPQLLERLVQSLNQMILPENAGTNTGRGGGDAPVCVRDYAAGDNVLHRVNPVLAERKFNAIPVRVVIDKNGRVKHVHVISAFAEQSRIITDALLQWEFRPYRVNGQPVEVETGIMFGASPQPQRKATTSTAGVSD
jgi:hypothetical protein